MDGAAENRAGDPGLQTFGFRIPVKRGTVRGQYRQGILVGGPAGWGEYSPVPGYSENKHRACWACAVSSATTPWPKPLREKIPVAALVPAVPVERALEIVRTSGCSDVKVKVGDPADEERVEAVREALGPRGKIRIDANGAWSVQEAVGKIRAFLRYGIEFAEQPVASVEDMVKLRTMVDVPLAADELVNTPQEARSIALRGAADVLVLKVQHLGGVAQGLRTAEAGGLPVVVSSLMETSIGISAGLALAAALPRLDYACGLATAGLLESDLAVDPLIPQGGFIALRRAEPDPQLLARFAADVAAPSGGGDLDA